MRAQLAQAVPHLGGPVAAAELPAVMGWPDDPDRAARVAATVAADGLAVTVDGDWNLT